MTDVLQTIPDDVGEIEIVGGQITLSNGLETAVVNSLFGGNENDSGGSDTTTIQYWGNILETDPVYRLRSETQYLLRSLPATSGNLRRLEEAAKRDLAWMVGDVAEAVAIEISIPRLNWVHYLIEVTVNGSVYPFQLTSEWKAARR